MKKTILLLVIFIAFAPISAQKKSIWNKISLDNTERLSSNNQRLSFDNQNFYELKKDEFVKLVLKTNKILSGLDGLIIGFPNKNGEIEDFSVWENSNFEPELQAKYPDIRSYIGKSISERGTTIHFSVSPIGIKTMVLRADNSLEFIEPLAKNNSVYVSYNSNSRKSRVSNFRCKTTENSSSQNTLKKEQLTTRASNKSFKTLRLAISCTGEYSQYFGGASQSLAAMNATMTRVNGIYERDMALHFNIIANNNLVIYTNPIIDPYSDADIGYDGAWNNELQTTLTNVLGNGAYDIGHLFAASGGGGNAGCIGCVCVDDNGRNQESKGRGFTSPSDGIPEGDFFDIDYVAHEIGHQLGANHTFSYDFEGSGVQVEPGSGSTIMGYAGITDYDVQFTSDPYFTYRSIEQIQNNLATKSCPISISIINSPPTVDAGADFTIPSGTAYILKGMATDKEGDFLTYCWEQNNSADNSQTEGNSRASLAKTLGPVYRSFLPTTNSNRYLPELSKVLAGELTTDWESVSNVARSLKFTLTVRDNNPNGAQTKTDEVVVTSKAPFNARTMRTGVGPFKITSQNSNSISWAQGTTQIINWEVNNTTVLPGSANVNIKLSVDGGATFPYILASNVPNDGYEVIIVPAIPDSSNCRIIIEPTENVYYAVNANEFTIANLSNTDFVLANFRLFPNNISGSFIIQFDSLASNEVEVEVHDLRGRAIFEKKYRNSGSFNQNITLNTIQSGLYLVTIKDGNKQVVRKIIIE